eukprot:m.12802 g.12802  ORF g.12802 m.12802 type:complete len:560 (-) comp4733_c0_seq2:884-2563(-)
MPPQTGEPPVGNSGKMAVRSSAPLTVSSPAARNIGSLGSGSSAFRPIDTAEDMDQDINMLTDEEQLERAIALSLQQDSSDTAMDDTTMKTVAGEVSKVSGSKAAGKRSLSDEGVSNNEKRIVPGNLKFVEEAQHSPRIQQLLKEAAVMPDLITKLREVIWGKIDSTEQAIKDVLKPWLQGFFFEDTEPTALVQRHGGPCGVLAPVQAFIMKNLIYTTEPNALIQKVGNWRHGETAIPALICALTDILIQCSQPPMNVTLIWSEKAENFEEFHTNAKFITVTSRQDLETILASCLPDLQGTFGVLMMMYSFVATRGVDKIVEDLGLDLDPLISMPFGHANLSLVNLCLTGVATSHVHDGIQDVGVPLKGIEKQPEVGYLSIMESLRYITVGSLFKNPKVPVWVLGSETHMTVLFSLDTRLVSDNDGETTITQVERAFQELDTAGGGFIMMPQLPKLLEKLGLDSSETNVKRLSDLIEGDIVLLTNFLEIQYPGISRDSGPANFTLYHYNGIATASMPLTYTRGVASTSTPTDFGSSPMMQLLRTKWPRLQVEWDGPASIS